MYTWYTWCMIQEFCLQRYDWIFRCMFRKYSKKTIHYNYILPHDLHKRCKTLVHHCSCKCTGDPLKTARSRKKPVKFHDLGCFFLQNTCMQGYIYIYKWKRNWFQWSFPNPNVPRYNAMPWPFWNKSCLPPIPKKKGVESERSPIFCICRSRSNSFEPKSI